MADRTDELLESFVRAPVAGGSPAAARAAGERRRRRRGGLTALAAAAAVAVVVGGATLAHRADDPPAPPVAPTSRTPELTATPPSASPPSADADPAARFWLTTAPASERVAQGDVPTLALAQGIVDMRGDGGTISGPSATLEGVDRTLVCGRTLLDQSLPLTGRLVATGTGPEYGEVHQVVSYADVATAVAQMGYLRDLVGSCPRAEGDPTALGWSAMLFVSAPADTGYDSFTFGQYLEGSLGIGTYQVTRVGRSVLFVEVSGETTRADLGPASTQLTRTTRTLAPLLCRFTVAGC